jgi:hypothetical protein
VDETNNGESPAQSVRRQLKRHNAKRCPLAIQERIINALASGDSKSAIARELRVSRNIVKAIEEQQWSRVEQRKARIAAQSERNATRAAERINAKLEATADIPLNVLVPVFGVSVDKMLALRGDNIQTLHHIHSFDLTDDDLIAFAVQCSEKRTKPAQATIVDPQNSQLASRPAADAPLLPNPQDTHPNTQHSLLFQPSSEPVSKRRKRGVKGDLSFRTNSDKKTT